MQEVCNKHKQILDEYTLNEILGRGAYAIVKLGMNKISSKKYAIKIYDRKKLTDK